MTSEFLRRILCTASVVGFVLWTTTPHVAAAAKPAVYDWCSESCGETESCSTECENDGGGTITCGEYHDGPANGWCLENCGDVCSIEEACNRECLTTDPTDCGTYNGGVCENTCEAICSSMSSDGSESCEDDGGISSTCEDYGKKVKCNDGVCAAGETCICSECAQFCINGDVPSPMEEALPEPDPGYDDGAMAEACEAAVSFEFAESWDCPDWEYVSGLETEENPLCEDLAEAREYQQFVMNEGRTLGNKLSTANSCTPTDTRTVCVKARGFLIRADFAEAEYERLNSIPCYMYRN